MLFSILARCSQLACVGVCTHGSFGRMPACRGGVVAVLQRAGLVDMEVVADPRDALGRRKVHIPQFLEEGGKVLPLAMGGHLHPAPAQAGCSHHAQVAVSLALLCVVLAGPLSGPGGLRRSHVCMQRRGQLVYADDRLAGIQGTRIGVQHLLHGADEVPIGRGLQAPRLWPPRLQFVCCRVCRTVSWAIESATCRVPSSSAHRRKVQRACPAGAGPQASWTSAASPTPSRRRGRRG